MLELEAFEATAGPDGFRRPMYSDLQLLAELMLDAYAGTIDHDGETLSDAQQEIEGYLKSQPLLDHSLVLAEREGIRSACLLSYPEDRGSPLVAYIMTARAWKMHGLARQALTGALISLSHAGFNRVLATITDGNTASEHLFVSMGFKPLLG